MRFMQTEVAEAQVIDPTPLEDQRGRFMRAWCQQEFAQHGIVFCPLQANLGYSRSRGTVRGMHFQVAPHAEAKLVRCTKGAIFDVVLDLRSESATCGRWYGVELSAENGRMLYLPAGCAHGYQTLGDDTEMYYMTSAVYAPSATRGVRFDDPAFGVRWPLPVTIISNQDRNWPLQACSLSRQSDANEPARPAFSRAVEGVNGNEH